MMALCSLLIETLQCYRDGLPTTYSPEYCDLARFNPPNECDVPTEERKTGKKVFSDFFSLPSHKILFPLVDGGVFYQNIRNGLLHQAQTKRGWRIRTGQPQLWNSRESILDRDKFADAVEAAFNGYLDCLRSKLWNDDEWKKARRKMWWMLRVSASQQQSG